MELDAVDGFVRRVVDVGGIGIELPRRARRDRAEFAFRAARGDAHLRQRFRLLRRLLAPMSSDDVIDVLVAAREIHRNLRKMLRRTALQEQHFVVGRDGHQGTQIAFGFLRHGNEILATMADFHDAGAGLSPFQHLGLGAA